MKGNQKKDVTHKGNLIIKINITKDLSPLKYLSLM